MQCVIGIPNLIYDSSKNGSVYHIFDKPIIVPNDKNIYRYQIESPVLTDLILYDGVPVFYNVIPEKFSNTVNVTIEIKDNNYYGLDNTDFQAIGHLIHGKIIGVKPRNIHAKIEKEILYSSEEYVLEGLEEEC